MTIRTYITPAIFTFAEALAIIKAEAPTPLPFLREYQPVYSMESYDGYKFRIVARIAVAGVADAPTGMVDLEAWNRAQS